MEALENGQAELGDILVRINENHSNINVGDIVKVTAVTEPDNIMVVKQDGTVALAGSLPCNYRYATNKEKLIFMGYPEEVTNYEIY